MAAWPVMASAPPQIPAFGAPHQLGDVWLAPAGVPQHLMTPAVQSTRPLTVVIAAVLTARPLLRQMYSYGLLGQLQVLVDTFQIDGKVIDRVVVALLPAAPVALARADLRCHGCLPGQLLEWHRDGRGWLTALVVTGSVSGQHFRGQCPAPVPVPA